VCRRVIAERDIRASDGAGRDRRARRIVVGIIQVLVDQKQVASQRVAPGGRVIAIDLLEIAPISGVTVLKGDFREKVLLETLEGRKADAVLSDVSPNLSGIGNVDQARALELTGAAIDFCREALKAEGFFLVKAFHGEAFGDITARLKKTFAKVRVIKPSASRGESAETYVVARGLTGL